MLLGIVKAPLVIVPFNVMFPERCRSLNFTLEVPKLIKELAKSGVDVFIGTIDLLALLNPIPVSPVPICKSLLYVPILPTVEPFFLNSAIVPSEVCLLRYNGTPLDLATCI